MITVALLIIAGVVAGYFLKEKQTFVKYSGKVTMWLIYLLLFFLGLTIGNNEFIMQQLPEIGFKAMVINFVAIGGGVGLAFAYQSLTLKTRQGAKCKTASLYLLFLF